MVFEMVKKNVISEEQARLSAQSNVILKALGVNPDIEVFEGRIASGDQFVADQGVKDFVVKEFGAYAVEMEGAAIAQAAYLNNVPFLVIRAISDKADGSAEMDYPTFEAMAAEHSFKLTLRILKDIQG